MIFLVLYFEQALLPINILVPAKQKIYYACLIVIIAVLHFVFSIKNTIIKNQNSGVGHSSQNAVYHMTLYVKL